MKLLIKNSKICSGVSVDTQGNYIFDYYSNSDSDIVELHNPQLYESTFGNGIYRFGYEFNDTASSKDRTQFIQYLNGIGDNQISEEELVKFISRPLAALNLFDLDCFIYPLSNRSKLATEIVKVINRFISRDMTKMSFELVKSIPNEVEFDWKSFIADNGDDEDRLTQMTEYVENTLMPKIHDLDYFSLAKSVKPKYRKCITNYLRFSSDDVNRLAKLDNANVLIVDDINTSGATLDEILRIVKKINRTCAIYIYTLIGRD